MERVHQTLQDRFTNALRLAGISDIEAANTLLQSYLPTHNARFAEPPLDPEDAHRSTTLDHADLRRILSHHHVRTVDKHGAIRFERRALHIDANHRRRTVGKRLIVITTDDKIELWHGQTPVPLTTRKNKEKTPLADSARAIPGVGMTSVCAKMLQRGIIPGDG